ncbi:unnamed protein product [Rotaria socialis]|uniref:F-box domain-containing protein n=1 Tax=Rotaria socialis TaxID=392032 RepID=A0A820ES11_9BILA|nr:unnamed protein product [Rotaria socialis]CAF3452245.1 unnamed protein product [Rotaria socialis]CAF3458983.1 unnamed protein product [Rotaria socialis]CAF3514486.1 unnamed protein product [Rotaria socialis]CAF4129662.1 unnamed protein product [Rotaria socialis]
MCPTVLNRIESFSNELLLDIFEYLDAFDLYQAFYGLNYRINDLLQSAQLHIVCDSLHVSNSIHQTLLPCMKPSQIRMVSFYNDLNIDSQFLSSTNENLRLVRLHEINPQSANAAFQHIPASNQIKCLSIRERRDYTKRNDSCFLNIVFVDQAHRFKCLVNLSLSLAGFTAVFPTVSIRFLELRRLSIYNYDWTIDFIGFLQNNVPNLKSLHFIGNYRLFTISSDLVLKHITELHMNHSGSFANLQTILSLFPCLYRLHLDQSGSHRSAIINGAQWQKLIESCLPHLKQLTIDFGEGIGEDIVQTFYTGEFWIAKRVMVKMIVNKSQSRYRLVKLIYFGHPWHFKYFHNFNT